MEAKSLYDYFFFGTSVRYLQDAKPGFRIHDNDQGMFILTNINAFLVTVDKLNLQVTSRACKRLRHLFKDFKLLEDDAVLSVEQAKKLSGIVDDIRLTLEAKIKGFQVYTVTPKRIDVTKLMADISYLFAPNVFTRLPAIARFDIEEAGKCIAFERPTAAAFHLMRSTEAVLRAFFEVHIKTSAENLWGPMVKLLRGKLQGPEHIALLNNLDNIRLSFRNPTQHPDKIYDIQEVQDLWSLCVDVINRMSKDLPIPSQ